MWTGLGLCPAEESRERKTLHIEAQAARRNKGWGAMFIACIIS